MARVMAKFLKLHPSCGGEIYVNMETVTCLKWYEGYAGNAMFPKVDPHTTISFLDGSENPMKVTETPEQIVELLKNEQ